MQREAKRLKKQLSRSQKDYATAFCLSNCLASHLITLVKSNFLFRSSFLNTDVKLFDLIACTLQFLCIPVFQYYHAHRYLARQRLS